MAQINDLVFKELVKRGYNLEGNTRIFDLADSKLWYITPKQAQAFLDLEKSKDYQTEIIQKEIDLITNNFSEIQEEIGDKPINIVDLGCGDGKKVVVFIEHMKEVNKIRYCPIDISNYMVKQAINRIEKLNVSEIVQFQWNVSDFAYLENIVPLLVTEEYKKNLFLLLGNTAGNFEVNDLFYMVSNSMREDDVIVIGNGLNNNLNREEMIFSYQNSEVNDFMMKMIQSIGLDENDVTFGVRFRNSRIETFYTLETDKTVVSQEKVIHFIKGDQITTAVSYKYNQKDFINSLNKYFTKTQVFLSEKEDYILAVCKK